MRVVRGRAEARWLPSRHRFALFRLWAFLRLRRATPEPRAGLMLMIEPDQSAVECYGVSSWVWLTGSAYFAFELSRVWPLPLAILAALPLGSIAVQIPIYTMGAFVLPALQAITRSRFANLAGINSVLVIALHTAAASYFALERTWVRFVAWQFLFLIGLNALAAAIVFLLRGPIARLEARYECAS